MRELRLLQRTLRDVPVNLAALHPALPEIVLLFLSLIVFALVDLMPDGFTQNFAFGCTVAAMISFSFSAAYTIAEQDLDTAIAQGKHISAHVDILIKKNAELEAEIERLEFENDGMAMAIAIAGELNLMDCEELQDGTA